MSENCHSHRSPGDVPLASLRTDEIDFGFLSATRFFFLSFSQNDQAAWMTAILNAHSFYPKPDSSEVMRKTLAVVQEMRMSRRSCFHFSNPRCKGCSAIVTQDERYLLQMFQHARTGRNSAMASCAMLLCEGNSTDRVIDATLALARRFKVDCPETVTV